MRELLGHIESMFAIRFGHVRGLVQQLQNGLPGVVELIGIIGSRIFRRKGNHGIRLIRAATRLNTHFTPSASVCSPTNFTCDSPGHARTFIPSNRFIWECVASATVSAGQALRAADRDIRNPRSNLRSSQDFARCARATARARSKYASAFAASGFGDLSAIFTGDTMASA